MDATAIRQIVDVELDKLTKRIAKNGYNIKVTDEAKDFLASKGYDPQFGARPLKRYLQNYVETLTAKKILSGEVHAGDTILLDVKEGEFTVSTK